MKNPATADRNALNSFTMVVGLIAEQGWPADRFIRLRNGNLVQPEFNPAEDDLCEDSFIVTEPMMYWNLDGTSVKSRDYDMMELV
jgi:hypothetical protein